MSGNFVWNNWADGDPDFTVGPPEEDAIFRIQKIVMYYNTSADNEAALAAAGNSSAASGAQGMPSPQKSLILGSLSMCVAVAWAFR